MRLSASRNHPPRVSRFRRQFYRRSQKPVASCCLTCFPKNSPDFRQNFAGISRWSTSEKGITTRPSNTPSNPFRPPSARSPPSAPRRPRRASGTPGRSSPAPGRRAKSGRDYIMYYNAIYRHSLTHRCQTATRLRRQRVGPHRVHTAPLLKTDTIQYSILYCNIICVIIQYNRIE